MASKPAPKYTLSRDTYRKVKNMDRARMEKYVHDVYMAGYAAGRKEVAKQAAESFVAGMRAKEMEAQEQTLKEVQNGEHHKGSAE